MAVSADCHRGVTGHLHRRATGAIIVVVTAPGWYSVPLRIMLVRRARPCRFPKAR